MASTQPLVALILGAGPRIGLSVATKFANLGYSVATVSRSGTGQVAENGTLSIQADLSDLDAIPGIFTQVNAAFQAFPSVVVCVNGALTPPPDNNIFAVPPERVAFDFKVNTIAPYVAAREAVKGWATLPKDIKKTFIYTGNSTNVQIIPMALMLDVGIGKSASASWVGLADTLLSPNGYRFFYAAERNEQGQNAGAVLDGPAAGEFYAHLATHPSIPWHATFVKGKGYVEFP